MVCNIIIGKCHVYIELPNPNCCAELLKILFQSVISTPARVSTRNSRQKVKESAAGAAKESTADAAKESAASAAKESAAGAAKESAAGTAKAEETNRVKESRPSQSETLKNAEQVKALYDILF